MKLDGSRDCHLMTTMAIALALGGGSAPYNWEHRSTATQEKIKFLVPKERGRSEDDHYLCSEAEEGTQCWPSGTKKTGCMKGWAFERGACLSAWALIPNLPQASYVTLASASLPRVHTSVKGEQSAWKVAKNGTRSCWGNA